MEIYGLPSVDGARGLLLRLGTRLALQRSPLAAITGRRRNLPHARLHHRVRHLGGGTQVVGNCSAGALFIP